jgi:UDP:flavonoid glycosyltransferase YjiC (YdhE family)
LKIDFVLQKYLLFMTNPNILFLPASIRSHIMPAMYLADLLSDRYTITFAVTNNILEKLVCQNGYKSISQSGIKPLIGMESSYIATKKNQKVRFWNLVNAYLKNEVYEFRKKELYEILEKTQAIAVIIDIFSSTDYLVLNSHPKKPKLFFFNPMLSTYRIKDFPIVSESNWPKSNVDSIKIKENKLSSMDFIKHPKLTLLNYLNKKQNKQVFVKSGVSESILAVNSTFTKIFRGVPELILAPLEFEISPEVKQSEQYYLGLCTRENRYDIEIDNSFEEEWQTILEAKKNNKKIIYCSFGTFYEGPNRILLNFLKIIISAAKSIPDTLLIISINRFIIEIIQKDEPNLVNVLLFSRVPQLKILSVSNVFITHGGLGSIKEAIHYKVPLLVYPLDLNYDQNGNGFKVEYHQLGLRGVFGFDKAHIIKEKIMQLLNNEIFIKNISEFKEKITTNYSKINIQRTLDHIIK